MTPHLVLVGLMGSGKSTLGRLLSERMQWPFHDVDAVVEEQSGSDVRTIITEEGEATFRQLEAAVLARLLASGTPAVIATGGGAVLDKTNRSRLVGSAVVVWLRADPTTLVDRVGDGSDRPLLDDGVEATLRRLSDHRAALYHEVATTVVDTDGLGPDEVADAILGAAVVRGHLEAPR